MKNVFRKLFKYAGLLCLALILTLGLTYIYLSMQIGVKAVEMEVFQSGKSPVLVFAHRGGGGIIPENTIEAFKFSADLGVDFLELDIHGTKDGKLVVLHDSTVDRTTNGTGKISEMTLEQVKKLDAGYNFSTDNQTFPFRDKGINISTLEEIFDAFPYKKFNIEPKQSEPSITKPLCQLLREKKMTARVIVGSFRQEVLDEFRQECPEVATSASPSEVTKFLTYQKTGIGNSYSPPMQVLQVPIRLGVIPIVTKDFVETAHKLNLQVHVWTINETERMQQLIDLDVDGIMTDYPEKLIHLIKEK